jgi:small subunit ribosomal protein S3Ae
MAKKETKKTTKLKPKKTDSRRTTDKWKKKKWYTIFAPKMFDQKEIGETIAEKPETLKNRVINLNARELTGNPKKQHISLYFKINNVQGLKAYTKLIGHKINPNFLKRVIRRRTSKMETTQIVSLKDKEKARVKAVVVSGRKLTKIKETAVRKIMLEKIAYASKKRDFDDFVNEMVFGNIAFKIQNEAKKIGFVKRVEIVKTKLIEGK